LVEVEAGVRNDVALDLEDLHTVTVQPLVGRGDVAGGRLLGLLPRRRDVWSLFAAAASRTSRLRMGPEVTGVILKDPTIIAQQAATLDELTGGRPELVFSTGNFAMLEQYHVDRERTRSLARLREAHEIL
jgi:hypothetical protein